MDCEIRKKQDKEPGLNADKLSARGAERESRIKRDWVLGWKPGLETGGKTGRISGLEQGLQDSKITDFKIKEQTLNPKQYLITKIQMLKR